MPAGPVTTPLPRKVKNNAAVHAEPLRLSRLAAALATVLLTAGLAACGGGGGSGSAPSSSTGGGAASGQGQGQGGGGEGGGGAADDAAPSPGGAGRPPVVTRPPITITGSNTVGAWDPRILPWSDGKAAVLPLHAVLLADGRVMSYGTHSADADGRFEFNFDVWTPPSAAENDISDDWRHMVLPTGIETHLFCSAPILIPATGQVLINGGDNWAPTGNTNTGTSAITLYSPATNRLTPAGRMFEPRWYASVLTLPDGRTYTQGGTDGSVVYGGVPIRATSAEIRDPATGQSRQLTGFDTRDLDNNYPRNYLGPDGMIYGFDHQILYRIDPSGAGRRTDLYNDDYEYGWTATSTSVMFEPGRILQVGKGGWKDLDEGRTPQIIDINQPTPTVTNAARTMQRREWANTTVLPDGKVVLMGGSENNAIADDTYTNLGRIGYEVEIYDPVTNTWKVGPAQQRMRLYHSIALLLPNGTVLSAAGGWPGPQLNLDAEIYYPPDLFNADGTPAKRPTISSAPTVLDPGATLTLGTPDAADISRITIVKTGAVTHSFNFEQRFIELGNSDKAARPIARQGDQLQVRLPANRFETPPGYYMAFVLNRAGVPSEGRIFRINPSN